MILENLMLFALYYLACFLYYGGLAPIWAQHHVGARVFLGGIMFITISK